MWRFWQCSPERQELKVARWPTNEVHLMIRKPNGPQQTESVFELDLLCDIHLNLRAWCYGFTDRVPRGSRLLWRGGRIMGRSTRH